MYPSSLTRRKRVERELFDMLHSPNPGEFICKLVKSQGNCLFTAIDEFGNDLLLSIPERFRRAFYFSAGDYALCTPLDNPKVKAEIRALLHDKQIGHLVQLGFWPKSFPTKPLEKHENQGDPYISDDMLPPCSDQSDSSNSGSEDGQHQGEPLDTYD
ncbi:unnamed protein product [Dicrocoelium dendriticum]|nr:unnamed protein product [Dicrocoelium dendriticum]